MVPHSVTRCNIRRCTNTEVVFWQYQPFVTLRYEVSSVMVWFVLALLRRPTVYICASMSSPISLALCIALCTGLVGLNIRSCVPAILSVRSISMEQTRICPRFRNFGFLLVEAVKRMMLFEESARGLSGRFQAVSYSRCTVALLKEVQLPLVYVLTVQ